MAPPHDASVPHRRDDLRPGHSGAPEPDPTIGTKAADVAVGPYIDAEFTEIQRETESGGAGGALQQAAAAYRAADRPFMRRGAELDLSA